MRSLHYVATSLVILAEIATHSTSAIAKGQDASTPAVAAQADMSATRVLTEIAQAQQALSSYSATIRSAYRRSVSVLTASEAGNGEVHFVYAKPDRASAKVSENGRTKAYVADGVNHFVMDSVEPLVLHKTKAGSGIDSIAAVFGQSGLSSSAVFEAFLTRADVDPSLILQSLNQIAWGVSTQVTQSTDRVNTRDSVPVDVVSIHFGGPDNSGEVTIVAGKQDHLLRRITFRHSGFVGTDRYFDEAFTDVKGNPALPANAFTAPAGAKEIDDPAPVAVP